jgi:hypothetical protein
VVSTQPTPAGEAGLDPFHPLGGVKRLRNKPLRGFEGSDQFLRLLQVRAAAAGKGRGQGREAAKAGHVGAQGGWVAEGQRRAWTSASRGGAGRGTGVGCRLAWSRKGVGL